MCTSYTCAVTIDFELCVCGGGGGGGGGGQSFKETAFEVLGY